MTESIDPHSGRRRCRGCDYALDGLPAGVCPECGRAFDPGDPSTFLAVMPDRRELARVHALHAHALAAQLQAEQIHAIVEEDPNPMLGASARVWVAAEDLERASEFMVRAGDPETAEDEGEDWTCAACAETVEGIFGACWSCGAERPTE